MKSKQISIIVMAVLLVALVAVYFAVGNMSDDTDSADTGEAQTVYQVSNISTSAVKNISFTNGGEALAFSYDGSAWSYDGDANFPVDSTVLDDMASAVCAIEASREIEAEDVSEYGLDQPLHTVTVDCGDKSYIFKIGDYNKHSDVYYLSASDSGKVYTVTSDFEALFDVELYDMLKLETMDSITASTVTKITAKDAASGATITLELDSGASQDTAADTGDGDTDDSSKYIHTNYQGGQSSFDEDTALDIISALCAPDLDTCAEYYLSEEQFDLYGLDDENRITVTVYYTIELSTTDSTTGATSKTKVDKQYTYYIGYAADKSAETDTDSADTAADTADSTEQGTDEETETVKTYLVLSQSNMIFEVDLSDADAFFN